MSNTLKTTELKNFAKSMPETFGIYLMFDTLNNLLYVGKSKNLKNRVSSYFREKNLSPRISKMVLQIDRIEFITVKSEAEALILENNYIKNYNPKYNILFRDDKSYPYLILSDHNYPRLFYFRGKFKNNDEKQIFGPFPHANAVYETIQLLQRIFKIRTCKDSIFANRTRACLLYNIDRCSAPCVEKISKAEYDDIIKQIILLLKGKKSNLIMHLTNQMNQASENLDFEKAIFYRNQIQSLNQIQQKQYISSQRNINADIIGIFELNLEICFNVVNIKNGDQMGEKRYFFTNTHRLNKKEIYDIFYEFYYEIHEKPEIIINEFNLKSYNKIDESKIWLEMATENAKIMLYQKLNKDNLDQTKRLDDLKKRLNFDLNTIDCFDISHLMGHQTVASCVAFERGFMQKNRYRHYNFGDENFKGDDILAMKTAIQKHYQKNLLPDLLLIDGGLTQLMSAHEAINSLNLKIKVFILSITKGEGRKSGLEKFIYLDEHSNPLELYWKGDSPAHLLLQTIRDEAHRFAITYHRKLRNKQQLISNLDDLKMVGKVRKQKLLIRFGHLENIKKLSVEELMQVDGINQKVAESIWNQLNNKIF